MDPTPYRSLPDIPVISILTDENEILIPDDTYIYGRLKATTTQSTTSHEQSFGNFCPQRSFTNSMVQHSFQNSNTLSAQHARSTDLLSPTQSLQTTHSMLNTNSTINTRSIQNTESNTQSDVYARYASLEEIPNCFKKRSWLGEGIRNLREASLSISMLAKPSDDRKASSFLAGWNISSLIQGTTILGMPYAILQGGWAAVAMVLIVGFLTCHTGKLLIDCMYETSKKTGIQRRLRINYPEVAQAALGRKGFIMMHIIQNSVMFGGIVMYIILLGTVWADLNHHLTPHLGIKEWAVINCCFSLPTLFIMKMSIVSWFSMLSVFSIIAAFLVLMTFSLTQIPLWDVANIPPFDMETFPIGFGIIMFSFCAHAVLPNIEGSMKKPQSYNTMMNGSFALASLSKATIGVLMVLRFGKHTAEVATVNLNGHDIFSKLTSCLVIANVLLAMPLEMFIVSVSYDNAMLRYFTYINRSSGYHWIWLLISRPLLLTLSLLVSVTVPRFGLLMGLIGSLSGTSLCFIFPCYCHMKLKWDSLTIWNIASDMLIIIFGIAAGVFGLFFSIKALICC